MNIEQLYNKVITEYCKKYNRVMVEYDNKNEKGFYNHIYSFKINKHDNIKHDLFEYILQQAEYYTEDFIKEKPNYVYDQFLKISRVGDKIIVGTEEFWT